MTVAWIHTFHDPGTRTPHMGVNISVTHKAGHCIHSTHRNKSLAKGDSRMKQQAAEKPTYGNWVTTRLVYMPAAVSLIIMGFAVLIPFLVAIAALFSLCLSTLRMLGIYFPREAGTCKTECEDWCCQLWIGMEKGRYWI